MLFILTLSAKHFLRKVTSAGAKFNCNSYVRNMSVCKIAVCQVTSTNDKENNFESVQRLVQEATKQDIKFLFFPEAVDYVGESKEETLSLAEMLDGNLMSRYRNLAKDNKVWLSLGGIHEKLKQDNRKLYNTHIVINDEGSTVGVYRKLHLFDVEKLGLKESNTIEAGTEISKPVQSPIGLLGLSICYDLRFPELSIILRKKGANVLTYPSAFTHVTGEAHWEVLLRARAIENQCYVIAAAQFGRHNGKRVSHGHAMIVDPWGKIIAECPKYDENGPNTNESFATAILDTEYLEKIRTEMPVLEHRRRDMYRLTATDANTSQNTHSSVGKHKATDSTSCTYYFSNKSIPASTVFLVTGYSYAFTNIRCVVPGHVLVAPIRSAKRLHNLTDEEVEDFFKAVVKVQRAVESMYNASSSTVCIQDGPEAGQTVSHVHCHILPRIKGDFENNDEIYERLAKHDKENEAKVPARNLEEQIQEAEKLKSILH